MLRLLSSISFFAAVLGTANGFSSLASRANVAVVSNKATSLRILYQNNLNSTDDINHVPFLLLDPVVQSNAKAACLAFDEALLSTDTLSKHSADFQRLFAYLEYSGYHATDYFVQNGVLALSQDGSFSVTQASSYRSLPVLCTNTRGGPAANTSNEIAIDSKSNTYVGSRNQKAFQFLGVPYADKAARFEYSKVYTGQNQQIQSTAYPAQCAQASSGSEDCLYLNIFSPYIPKAGSSTGLKPVLLWIHGGGFTGGNGQTDGSNLASREDIIFVSIQYRLSTLGFLAVPGTNITGNYGIGDQVTALKVR